jgi:diguanylate cyclase (GGDEF)-like protein
MDAMNFDPRDTVVGPFEGESNTEDAAYAGLRLFRDVDHVAVGHYLKQTGRRDLAEGEVLISPETTNDCVYVVLSGSLNVHLDSVENAPLTTLGPGQCAGEMSLIEERDPSAWVVAGRDAHLMVIDQRVLWRLIDLSHAFSRNLLVVLSSRLRKDNDVIADSVGILREFERHAVTDALTELHNRHWLDDMFRRRMQRCAQAGEDAALIMADVDRFKAYNDRYGHIAGDRALRLVADQFKRHFRPTDMLARFGGDEFAILLPGAAVGDAVTIAERVVCAVAGTEAEAPVTLSAGVAGMKAGDSLESLLRRADDALYRAKIAGRNRVSC